MTTYQLMDGVAGRPGNGPPSVTATSGGWLIGVMFSVTGKVMWLDSYRIWVPANGDTTARKFALWNVTSSTAQTLIPGSTVTSGAMTQGAWNTVALASPVQLAPGALYVAAAGWNVSSGIAVTSGQFGAAAPFAAGIVNGPLTAWSATGGSNQWLGGASGNYGHGQQMFSNVLGSDPAAAMPNNGSGDDNLWIDITVDDTAPAAYAGSYRLWPNFYDGGNFTLDTANNFTLGTAFSLSGPCVLNALWLYSPAGVTQLPTAVGVIDAAGNVIASNFAPAWTLPGGGAAAAGAGWIYATVPGSVRLSGPGTNYWAVILNGAGVPAIWNAAVANYWSAGFGSAGLTAGPITAPSDAAAPAPGQNSYHLGAALHLPDTHAGPFSYWVDIEVTPAAAAAGGGFQIVPCLAGAGVI